MSGHVDKQLEIVARLIRQTRDKCRMLRKLHRRYRFLVNQIGKTVI